MLSFTTISVKNPQINATYHVEIFGSRLNTTILEIIKITEIAIPMKFCKRFSSLFLIKIKIIKHIGILIIALITPIAAGWIEVYSRNKLRGSIWKVIFVIRATNFVCLFMLFPETSSPASKCLAKNDSFSSYPAFSLAYLRSGEDLLVAEGVGIQIYRVLVK